MYGRRESLRPAIAAVLFSLLLLSATTACGIWRSPDKIPRLNSLAANSDGAQVEFAGRIREIVGDGELGFELLMFDAPDVYPQAIVELKPGQTPPKKDREVCIKGQIAKHDDFKGGTILRIKSAEIIDCY
jgi:hypothetical protein